MSFARVLAALLLLASAACSESTLSPLEVTDIAPARRPVDFAGWLILEGSGFEPRITWQGGASVAELDEQYEVRVADQASPEVHRLGPNHLAFRIPAGLSAGRAALEVRAPDGRRVDAGPELCLYESPRRITFLVPDAVNLGLAGEICLSADDPTAGSCTVLSGGDRVPMHEDAYAVSPDGSWLAHAAAVQDPGGAWISLRLRSLTDPGRAPWEGERLAWQGAAQGWVGDVAVPVSRPVFSRDGGRVAWVEEGRRLLLVDLREGSLVAETVATIPPSAEGALGYPDFDPRGDAIVVTYFDSPRQIYAIDSPRALHRIELGTGTVTPAVEVASSDDLWDGPGRFSPDGRDLVFLSSRYGLELRFGAEPGTPMVPAWMSFESRLSTGAISPVNRPSVELGLSQPILDSTGRFLTVQGFKGDSGASELDLLVRDRETGEFLRPEGRLARDLDCPGGAAFCNAYHGHPAFTADGRTLFGVRALYASYQILGITTDVELHRTIYRSSLPATGEPLPGEAEGWSLPRSDVVHYTGAAYADAMAPRPFLQGDCP